ANAKKVADAAQAWVRVNNSRTFTDTNWTDGTATDLISGSNMYLDALPKLTENTNGLDSLLAITDTNFKAMPIASVSITPTDTEGTNFNCLMAVVTSTALCKSIARLSRGDSANPRFRNVSGSTLGDFSTPMSSSRFDCVVNDANNNSTLDSGESMFFIYKVF
ncbi:MAG TPA: hypothetical protein DIS76_03840, partial [Rhodospirillaceae bacterium]|nr:hypothetical protein [Rhodospirillaceae bacterium]